jgi:hypothetical protein
MARVSIRDDVEERQIDLNNESEGAAWLDDRPSLNPQRAKAIEDLIPEYVRRSMYVAAQARIEKLEAELVRAKQRNDALRRNIQALTDVPEYVHRSKYRGAQVTIRTQNVEIENLNKRYRKALKRIQELTCQSGLSTINKV